MRLIGILCWYDEEPSWLTACVSSMISQAGIDHLVALDGAYALFPGEARSEPEQHAAILAVCQGSGVGCTLHVPTEPFPGNEIEKRTLGFELAEHVSDECDWYFLMDADQMVTSAVGLKDRLARSTLDVGEVRFVVGANHTFSGFGVRCVFRALRGLHLHGAHWIYRTDDGRFLWGPAGQEPAEDLAFVTVKHRMNERSQEREAAKGLYYDRRDRLGAETLPA